MTFLARLKRRARQLKAETYALYLAARDPRTPWYAKLLVAAVVAYAVSPIDLIPDFVPVLGYLDDLILVPLGIALAVRLIPPTLMDEYRGLAVRREARPGSRAAPIIIVALWLVAFAVLAIWTFEQIR